MTSPSAPAAGASLAAEKYVLITTRKKSGDVVATPVWIAALADGSLGFTTDLTSGKAKRIRNFADVTLQPCNSRGVVTDGTSPVSARATLLTGDEISPVSAAIKAKYGLMVTVVEIGYSVGRIVRRRKKSPPAAVRLELA